MFIINSLQTFGEYLILMGRTFSRPERFRMFLKKYVKEMSALGVDSIGIVLLISFFIGAVICIQMKLNIQSPWMPKFVTGYTTREIMLLEFSSSIMCLILAGKVGSNIASELGTMRVTQQIDALEIMGVNSASYLILPKILGMLPPARFQPMVHVDEHHKESFLCLHHFECVVILRLFGGRRFGGSGQVEHRRRGVEQRADTLLRRVSHPTTVMTSSTSQQRSSDDRNKESLQII